MDQLLPNGSIVLLKGGNKKLMIYGRKQLLLIDEAGNPVEEGRMFDYLGVPYPEGYISPEYSFVFNHDDIREIIFKGYENQEEAEFQEVLSRT
ncbi:DUF4176 domain-containing protein [Caldibacillus lycopersici]|uniref:DUF4176 domain-containing protein n=1 Tax=Perspicuibacillus lycopersici TaxID=1325689 RepID=A0AAE3IS62_9BACI|nr:DUF4176 domain-containing protein [Perspicuibacillus lycopersici]MCU9613232.1 DUF4176 domain-containing protein [Perspicuibacillus lycopersici]